MILDLGDLQPIDKQNYLQHAIGPRPICFASTIDNEGNINLSPFSFFNLFCVIETGASGSAILRIVVLCDLS